MSKTYNAKMEIETERHSIHEAFTVRLKVMCKKEDLMAFLEKENSGFVNIQLTE